MIGCKQIGKKVAYSFEENDIWCMDEENYFFQHKKNFLQTVVLFCRKTRYSKSIKEKLINHLHKMW